MLSFNLAFHPTTKASTEDVSINGVAHNIYDCLIPGCRIHVYIPKATPIKNHEYYLAQKAFLLGEGRPDLPLHIRVGSAVEEIEKEQFGMYSSTIVRVNGRFIPNADNRQLKYVGIQKSPCKAGVLLVQGDTDRFSLFVCAFNKNANRMQKDVENGTYMDIVGELKVQNKNGRYEVRILDYELVSNKSK